MSPENNTSLNALKDISSNKIPEIYSHLNVTLRNY